MRRNSYWPDGDTIYLALTQDQVAIIDRGDLERVLRHRWHAAYNPSVSNFYVTSVIDHKTVYLHRFLLDAPKGMTVDHINHDTLDNRRANIRICTMRQNAENRNGAYNNNLLKLRNISTHRDGDRFYYMVRVAPAGKQIVRYFPYTPEGLELAKAAAIEMRQRYFTHSVKEAPSASVSKEA